MLAEELRDYAGRTDVTVLGLVRGGVPVAAQVAGLLKLPLEVLVVRKLGVPWAPEVAFGALGAGGVVVHTPDLVGQLPASDVEEVTNRAAAEVDRRERLYRPDQPPLDLTGQVALIVDDGLATGSTARAAVAVARRLGAVKVVVAVPVGAEDSVHLLAAEADEVVCPYAPVDFGAVSRFYEVFGQVSDDEVLALLDAAHTG